MKNRIAKLKRLLREAIDIEDASSVLYWDQTTHMPPGGAPARARQLSLLSGIAQKKWRNPKIGRLLDKLQPYAESLPYDDDEASLVRVARRRYEREIKVPVKFTRKMSEHLAESYQIWNKAHHANDFPAVSPYLQKTVDFSRQFANFFPGYDHIADPLIDLADYGMTVDQIRPLFSELREKLVPLVQAITARPETDNSVLLQDYAEDEQLAFVKEIIQQFGFDNERGSVSLTHHPYVTSFSVGDVRLNTYVQNNDLRKALFATMHEAGHALHAQGYDPAFEGTPLASNPSSGVAESQSRTWENLVGRSLPFWRFYYPRLQARFPDQLDGVSLEDFYKAINKVKPSLIRVEADEVTYNLHVMVRFDLECELLEGTLEVKDLPAAWHARYESDLGLRAPDDRDGVLQDVHWYSWLVGGNFQGYTLGNIMSAQFYDQALADHPEIAGEIAEGKFGTLLAWQRENIHQPGKKFTADELLQRVTGSSLTIDPYMSYLKKKFSGLYELG